MKITAIRKGDIVHIDVRGQRFFARATGDVHIDRSSRKRGFNVEPLGEGQREYLPAYFITARQVIGHYSKRKGSA